MYAAGDYDQGGWQTEKGDVSPWIQINLKQEYALCQLMILQIDTVKFKQVNIELSDGTTIPNHELTNAVEWNIVNLPNVSKSNLINISRTDTWGDHNTNSGIKRVKAIPCYPGTLVFRFN